MLVFLDESGDTGLKLEAGSSPYFVVALVVFKDTAVAQAVDDTIAGLRIKLRLPAEFEFHFANLNRARREYFLKEIYGFEFSYYAIVINKAALSGPGFQYKESFYKFACRLVLNNAADTLENATVVIDSSGSREFKRQLTSYLRRTVNDPEARAVTIKKLKLQESHRNNLLQLADMVCGAVARSLTTKGDARSYRRWLKPRERHIQIWPKENPGLSSEGTHTIR